jgi:hypothetical protein
MADKTISALTSATAPLAGTEVLPIVQSSTTVKVAVSDLTAGRAISATQYTSTIATGTAPLVIASTTNVANLNASSLSGATFASPGAIGGTTASAITGTTLTGTDATDATSTTAAALKTAGGLAVVKKIYVGDNIVQATAAKGFNFTANTPAAGMTSQLLSWYEEGTWTPAFKLGATEVTAYSTKLGYYTRIGRAVTLQCTIQVSTKGAGSGGLSITGLPFANKSGTSAITNVWPYTGWTGLTAQGSIIVQVSGSACYLYQQSTTGVTQITSGSVSDTTYIEFTLTYTV